MITESLFVFCVMKNQCNMPGRSMHVLVDIYFYKIRKSGKINDITQSQYHEFMTNGVSFWGALHEYQKPCYLIWGEEESERENWIK